MRLLCKNFEILKIGEESHTDKIAVELNIVFALYMSLGLCTQSVYCDMSQLVVLLAFKNVSGLNKLLTFYHNLHLNLCFIILK